jgi:hypothetical protein
VSFPQKIRRRSSWASSHHASDFADRDQGCPGCPRTAERVLARGQLAALASGYVPLVAGDPAERPDGISGRARGAGAFDDLKARSRGQRGARDRFQPLNAPPAGTGAHKHDAQRWHRTTVPSPARRLPEGSPPSRRSQRVSHRAEIK